MNHWRTFIVLILPIWGIYATAQAQSYRNAIPILPIEVYQSMLNFAEEGEYPKVEASLSILSPIVEHITVKFKDNPSLAVKDAVKNGNKTAVIASIHRLI